jgi:hypothetical protein
MVDAIDEAEVEGHPRDIGWRAFGHSFDTPLKANVEDVKTVQGLLRHAKTARSRSTFTPRP